MMSSSQLIREKMHSDNERFASHFVQSTSGATAAGRADLLVLCTSTRESLNLKTFSDFHQ